MPLAEIEFELSAQQYEWMGYPGLRQGETLSVVLDAGVLLPDWSADSWFSVQQEPLQPRLVNIGPALYAFAGQIVEADLFRTDDPETGPQTAVVAVNCGGAGLRVTCAPQEDGLLPWGTWETRYLTGLGRLQGIVEEDYHSSVGRASGVTIWRFRRLVLTPGDPLFGQWHETVELPPSPFRYDRILVTARVHRDRVMYS
jgi:hypothetical protein